VLAVRARPESTTLLSYRLPSGLSLLPEFACYSSVVCSTSRWYITGSPFPQGRSSLYNALDLLDLRVKKPVDPTGFQKDKSQPEKVQAV
jgi:hypothetical protein